MLVTSESYMIRIIYNLPLEGPDALPSHKTDLELPTWEFQTLSNLHPLAEIME